MLGLVISIIVVSVLILTVSQLLTVRFTYESEFIIDIDFFIFRLLLYPSRNNKKEEKTKRKKQKLKDKYRNFIATKRGIEYLAQNSGITIHKVTVNYINDNPAKFAIGSQNRYSIYLTFLAYLFVKTGKLSLAEGLYSQKSDKSDSSKLSFDATVETTFLTALTAVLIFLREKKYRKRKAGF
jgi:hypothetical protein